MRVAFYVHSLSISGGTYVILQHAHWLQQRGFDVTVVYEIPDRLSEPHWHPYLGGLKRIWREDLKERHFDVAIATWWTTAFNINKIPARHYVYFVQSIESRFYSDDQIAERTYADLSYALPVPIITEAKWIASYLQEHYDAFVRRVPNGLRKDIYSTAGAVVEPRPTDGRLRVLVEGPLGVFFKNVERSIFLAAEANVGDVWLLTSSAVTEYPNVARTFSQVPIEKTADIYRSCDVILKLSYVEGMFGPPLEMFACGGTAVVYNVTGHDEYIRDGDNGLVINRDEEGAVVRALRKLHDNSSLLDRLKNGAKETAAAWPDWEESSRWFEMALMGVVVENRSSRNHLAKIAGLYTDTYAQLSRIGSEMQKFVFPNGASMFDSWRHF